MKVITYTCGHTRQGQDWELDTTNRPCNDCIAKQAAQDAAAEHERVPEYPAALVQLSPTAARGEISRMIDAAERLRDHPGSYFPARDAARDALKAWRLRYPELAAAEDAERQARRDADEERRQRAYEESPIGRHID